METCRPVLCPWGRVRDSSGECVWLSKSISVDRYLITLKLTPKTVLRESDLNSSTIEQLNISSPWPQGWMLYRIEYSLNENDNNFINQFYVVVFIKGGESDVEEIIQIAEISSVQDWKMKIYDEYITLTSNVSKTKFDHDCVTHTYLAPENIPANNAIMSISAISFCHQVQLSAYEFTRHQLSNSIVFVLTDQQYHDGEYMFVSDPQGAVLPRVCLGNSGFVDAPNATGSLAVSENHCFVIPISLWIMFSILY